MKIPARILSPLDAVAIIVGVVLGAGIFKTPSLVAAYSGSETIVILLWLAGGILSFVGALCYAELTTSYPDTGGDYYFIGQAFGSKPAFLFAWARMTVIQTGSIAMLAFIIGDYASEVLRIGAYSPSLYAAAVIAVFTGVNLGGMRQGALVQNFLTVGIILGLVFVVLAGLSLNGAHAPPVAASGLSVPGKAMIFVLLTYGGWNEAAYISAELRYCERNMTRVLLYSIAIITVMYIAANLVYLKGLGLAATARSETVAADLMRLAFGERGARFISLLVCVAAVSTMNAVIITGARTNYALGRDFTLFGFLGKWQGRNTPVNALLLQSAIALALVVLGTLTRRGFSTMVEYTAPVFWFFFLLVGVSLFILRRKDPGRKRPFRVPIYPLTPIVFCLFCLYMFQSSFAYSGIGALAGAAVLAAGLPVLYLALRRQKKMTADARRRRSP